MLFMKKWLFKKRDPFLKNRIKLPARNSKLPTRTIQS